MMPPQLRNAKRPKRSEPRPLAETLPQINVNDLNVPRNYQTYIATNISFCFPHVSSMRITWNMVEFFHSGRIQTFCFKWIKTGLGYPRPAFICECGRPVIKLYFHRLNLACRRCCNAIHASQLCGKHSRPILQAKRLRTFLEFKSGMSQRKRQRLTIRLTTAKALELASERIQDRAKLPQGNYGTRGLMHWR
jgi:hypothetical protein